MQAKLDGKPKCLFPSPSGRYVAYQLEGPGVAVGAKDVYLKTEAWPHTLVLLAKEHVRMAVAWTDDLPRAIVLTDGGNATVLFPDNYKPAQDVYGDYYSACFSTDGQTLFLGGVNGRVSMMTLVSVKIHPLTGMTQFQDGEHTSIITCMDVSAPGGGVPALLVTGSLDGTVRVWDTEKGVAVRRLAVGANLLSVRIAADGGRIMACTEQRVVSAWEPDSDVPKHVHILRKPPSKVFMLPEKFEIFTQDGQQDFSRIIMGSRWDENFQIKVCPVVTAAFDGKAIWVGLADGGVDRVPVSPYRPPPDSDWYKEADPRAQTQMVVTLRQPAGSQFGNLLPGMIDQIAKDAMDRVDKDPAVHTQLVDFARKLAREAAASTAAAGGGESKTHQDSKRSKVDDDGKIGDE